MPIRALPFKDFFVTVLCVNCCTIVSIFRLDFGEETTRSLAATAMPDSPATLTERHTGYDRRDLQA